MRFIRRYLEKRRQRKEAEEFRRRLDELIRKDQARDRYEQQHRNFRIGNEFEDYVIRMFDPYRFELIHRTPTNRETNGMFVPSMAYPDLRFREIATGRTFWVEVKYRSHTEENGDLTWCSYPQMCKYKKVRSDTGEPVFIVIGVGGNSHDPERIFSLNLDAIRYTTLYQRTYAHGRLYRRSISSLEQLNHVSL